MICLRKKVCPACDSQDITLHHPHRWEGMFGLTRDRCENCGYVGPMTLMDKEHADRLKPKKIRK